MLLQKINLKMKRWNNIKKKTKKNTVNKKEEIAPKKLLLKSCRGRKWKGKRV